MALNDGERISRYFGSKIVNPHLSTAARRQNLPETAGLPVRGSISTLLVRSLLGRALR